MSAATLLLAGTAASSSVVVASAAPTAVPGGQGAYSEKGADTCLGCHGDPAVTVIFQGRHAQPGDPRTPFGHGGLQCEACHGPGGAHVHAGGKPLSGIVDFGKHALASVPKQNSMCLGCHEQNAAHDWASGPHAASNLACADCHTLHVAKDPVFVPATQIEVCASCHQAEHSDLFKPSHHPLREGKMACTSCHVPHGSTAPAQLVKNTVNETCTSCHAEFRGPFLWEHQPVSEDCSTCHDAHGSTQCLSAGRRLHQLPFAGPRLQPPFGSRTDALGATS
jgi:DmsE family decaheme c-type cytochrome